MGLLRAEFYHKARTQLTHHRTLRTPKITTLFSVPEEYTQKFPRLGKVEPKNPFARSITHKNTTKPDKSCVVVAVAGSCWIH